MVPQCLLLVLPGASETVRELQVTCSIPPSTSLRLTYPEKDVTVAGHQGIGAWFILAVECVHPKLHPLQRYTACSGTNGPASKGAKPLSVWEDQNA